MSVPDFFTIPNFFWLIYNMDHMSEAYGREAGFTNDTSEIEAIWKTVIYRCICISENV